MRKLIFFMAVLIGLSACNKEPAQPLEQGTVEFTITETDF